MALATQGEAVTPEREYSAQFEAECVIGPHILNEKGTFTIKTSAVGPVSVSPGEEVTVKDAHATIMVPAKQAAFLHNNGAARGTGTVTSFPLTGTGFEPTELNVAKPSEFAEGLPFAFPVEGETAFAVPIPSEHVGEPTRVFGFGPIKVTGAPKEDATLAVNSEPAFTEVEPGKYQGTGKGIVAELTTFRENGNIDSIAPVVCSAPKGVVLAEVPIVEQGGTSTTTTTASTTVTAVTTTTTTVQTTSETVLTNWKLKAFLTDRNAIGAITLPSACTLNGHATVPGELEGVTRCPPFTALLRVFGLIPLSMGLTFTAVEPLHATITHVGAGALEFVGAARDNLGIASMRLLGLSIPLSCKSSAPVTLPLSSKGPSGFPSTGVSFASEFTLPRFNCSANGLIGSLFGSLLNVLLAGPHNPFTLAIEP